MKKAQGKELHFIQFTDGDILVKGTSQENKAREYLYREGIIDLGEVVLRGWLRRASNHPHGYIAVPYKGASRRGAYLGVLFSKQP